jgi:hypothetical protein
MPYLLSFDSFPEKKAAYPNNITPLVRLLGVNGKDAALSKS